MGTIDPDKQNPDGSLKPFTPPETVSESTLLAAVDKMRSSLQMQGLTPGTSVSLEYAQIQREWYDYSSLTAAVVATISQTSQQTRWPIASIESALTGKTIMQVMAGYGIAIAKNEKASRIYGRIAVDAKNKIRVATTIEAKRKAYYGINWAWTPSF